MMTRSESPIARNRFLLSSDMSVFQLGSGRRFVRTSRRACGMNFSDGASEFFLQFRKGLGCGRLARQDHIIIVRACGKVREAQRLLQTPANAVAQHRRAELLGHGETESRAVGSSLPPHGLNGERS